MSEVLDKTDCRRVDNDSDRRETMGYGGRETTK